MVISGRMWNSHPCGCFVKQEIQNGCHEITKEIFSIIFLSGTTNKRNPTIIRHRYNALNATIILLYIFPSKLYTGTYIHYRLGV